MRRKEFNIPRPSLGLFAWLVSPLAPCVSGFGGVRLRGLSRYGRPFQCRRFWLILLIWATAQLFAVGCAAIDKRVEKLAMDGKFEAARAELEDAGVGSIVAEKPEPAPDALRAREIFTAAVEKEYARQVDAQLSGGLARKAVDVAAMGRRLCDWSVRLDALEQECRARIVAIDAVDAQLRFAIEASDGQALRRSALLALRPFATLLKDSPATVASQGRAQELLLADSLESIPTESGLVAEFLTRFHDDLLLSGIGSGAAKAAVEALEGVAELSGSDALSAEQVRSLAQAQSALSGVASLGSVLQYCRASFDLWAGSRASRAIAAEEVGLDLLDALQRIQGLQTERHRLGAQQLLVAALVARARLLLVDPSAAPLAWLYLEAARAVAPDDDAIAASLSEAVGALRRAETVKTSIAIDISPTVEPLANRFLFWAVYDGVARASRPGIDWEWVDPVHEDPLVRIEIAEATLLEPRPSDLSAKTSSYLSHYQDVPNPWKSALESQLRGKKMSVDWAESSYDSAVSSHNIYPTDWSLMSVNSARTRYVMAVDDYNATVRQYNSTPDTISQPVHVPYTYREGVIRAGVVTSGKVSAGAISGAAKHSEVASDNLRIGTKYNDIRAASRRDDPLDIEIDGQAQLRRISKVVRGWMNDLDRVISQIPVQTRIDVGDDEAALLSWLSGPFGPSAATAEALKLPSWATSIGVKFEFPERDTPWDPIDLAASRLAEDAESRERDALAAACVIETYSTGREGIAWGSGALVSGDGLILTCAHVLAGPRVRVRFLEGPLKGEYEAEVVRINDRSDVALLRARGVNSSKWLSISSEPVERGLQVMAISNPSVGEGAIAHAAVTKGTVITPIAEEWGMPRLVTDVPIASGSSGGPLIDLNSGEIVGVITAVSRTEFNEGRASTATFCLAAPASLLDEWLGVQLRATSDERLSPVR
jgi:S1-C subfamily serine protease